MVDKCEILLGVPNGVSSRAGGKDWNGEIRNLWKATEDERKNGE